MDSPESEQPPLDDRRWGRIGQINTTEHNDRISQGRKGKGKWSNGPERDERARAIREGKRMRKERETQEKQAQSDPTQ